MTNYPDCARQDKIGVVWERIKKGMNETGVYRFYI
jgi:hypothetical protein